MSSILRYSYNHFQGSKEIAAFLGHDMVAIYFHGRWRLPFSSNESVMGQTRPCPLIMNQVYRDMHLGRS